MALLWAIAIHFSIPAEGYAQWFAWALSVGGMAVASFNYVLLIDKVRSGEITLEDLMMRR